MTKQTSMTLSPLTHNHSKQVHQLLLQAEGKKKEKASNSQEKDGTGIKKTKNLLRHSQTEIAVGGKRGRVVSKIGPFKLGGTDTGRKKTRRAVKKVSGQQETGKALPAEHHSQRTVLTLLRASSTRGRKGK